MRFKSIYAFTLIACIVFPLQVQAGWTRTYGGDESDWGRCVRESSDGGYIVVGTTKSFGAGDQDLWLFKTDEHGDTQWTRTLGDTEMNKGYCVDLTKDGGYIVSGNSGLFKSNSEGELEWQSPYAAYYVQQTNDNGYILVARHSQNIWLLKMDEEGDTLWTNIIGYGYGYCVKQTSDGGYIVSGELGGDTTLFDFTIIKTDETGEVIWDKIFLDIGYEHAFYVQETYDKGYIVTGTDDWTYLLLKKLDSSGEVVWEYSSEYDFEGVGNCVVQTPDSGYIVVGTKDTLFESQATRSLALLMKFDKTGWNEWTQTYGDVDAYSWGAFVQNTTDGGFIITGDTQLPHRGDTELWLIKTDPLGNVAVEEKPVTHNTKLSLTISIGRQVDIRYANYPQGFHAEIFDASGRKVDMLQSTASSGTITWGSGFSPGVYFIKPVSGTQAHKVVLIK